MIFATASGSKWGNYDVDVDKLLKDEEEDRFHPLHFSTSPSKSASIAHLPAEDPTLPGWIHLGGAGVPCHRETFRWKDFTRAGA